MSILSTSSKLVRVGDSYSAGEGISIENNVISVTGDYGHAYYPGENISISDDNVISSKDWSSDIDTAVQNASAETTAWVNEQGYITDASLSDYALITDVETTSGLLKMDIDTVSASITGKMDSTAFNDWQTGQYSNDIAGLTNNIDTVSGTVDDISATIEGLDIPTRQDIENASGYAYSQSTAWTDSQGYLTQHQDISYLATKNEVDTVSSFLSGAIDYVSANAGDEFPASANDAITAYQTYSGDYLTEHQDISNLATKDEVSAYTLTTTLEQVSGDIVGLIPDVSDFITNASAEATYQPIGQYASASDITGFATKTELETTSGEIVNLIPSTAGLATEQLVEDTSATITGMIPSTAGLATETDLQIVSGGVDYISGVALTSIPTGTMNITGFEYDGDDLITAYNGSAFAGQGGGSIDTIPVAVISPLVTGFSGESAYLGIESTALNLSSYVPVSAIGVNSQGYVSGISGMNISARNALTAQHAFIANKAYYDGNSNTITSYYQPKLTISGDAGTITSINGSAVGATIPEGWELVAGAGIEIVDDAENNQTTISVTAAGGNPEVESYVQTNSASIDDVISTYQTNSGSYITQETDWTNTITAASSYAYSEAVAQIPAPFDPTYISGVIDNKLDKSESANFYPMTGNPSGFLTEHQDISNKLDKSESANFYPMTGNPSGFLTSHQDISNKLDTTAFSDVSGTFLTAVNIPESANWNDATTYVQTNSSTIDNTVTNVSTNSGVWGGSALPISAGPGIKLEMVNNTLVASTDETLLWSGTLTSGNSINLSESVKNFNTVKFYGHDSTRNKSMIYEQSTNYLTGGETLSFTMQGWDNNINGSWVGFYYSQLNYTNTAYIALTNSGGNQLYINTESVSWFKNAGRYIILDKVVGINRINNA